MIRLDTGPGETQLFSLEELEDPAIMIIRQSPRLQQEPWAEWDPAWQLIGTQTDLAAQQVFRVLRVSQDRDRTLMALKWPLASARDLARTHVDNQIWAAEQLDRFLQRTKMPPKP